MHSSSLCVSRPYGIPLMCISDMMTIILANGTYLNVYRNIIFATHANYSSHAVLLIYNDH